MTVTKLTIGSAANKIIGSLRAEATAAAGSNSLLSLAEQKKLSPWAQATAKNLRETSSRVTVDGFVDAIAPKVRRALASISDDGKTVKKRDVYELRVDALRARAAKLFGTTGEASGSMTGLKKAVAAAEANRDFTDYGHHAYLSTVTGSLAEVMAKLVPGGADDIGVNGMRYYDTTTGSEAIHDFVQDLTEIADESESYGEDYDLSIAATLRTLTAQAQGAFEPASQWKTVRYASHLIEEDGDLEQRILMAQKKSGDWVVLEYQNFPF